VFFSPYGSPHFTLATETLHFLACIESLEPSFRFMVEDVVQRLRIWGRLLAELPPRDCRRWTPLRKYQVVNAVRAGALAQQAARELYDISEEELRDWLLKDQSLGLSALRVTKSSTAAGQKS
jgi:Protein of unknown function (DUF1153)